MITCSLCGSSDDVRPYPAGQRCTPCSPAIVAGRPPPPPPTGNLDQLSDTEHDRLVEVAIAQLEKKRLERERRARYRRR